MEGETRTMADLERFVKAGELPYLRFEWRWKRLVLLAIIVFIILMVWSLTSDPSPGAGIFYLFAIPAAIYLYPWLIEQLPYFKSQRRWRKEAEERTKEATRVWGQTLVLTALSTDRHRVFPQAENISFEALQQAATFWRFSIRQPGRDEDHPGLSFGLDLGPNQVRKGVTQKVWTIKTSNVQFRPCWRGAILTYALETGKLEVTISGPWPD